MDNIFIIGDVNLNYEQISVLKRGLNFVPTANNNYDCTKNEIKSSKRKLNELIRNTIINYKNHHGLPSVSHKPMKTPDYSLSKRLITEQLALLESLKTPPIRNLSRQESAALKLLKNDNNLIIKPADKNLGIAVLSTSIYNELCMQHINENNCYKRIYHDPLEATTKKVVTMIHHLHDNHFITLDQHNAMLPPKEQRLGIFYGLPKLHKTKLSIRPIVSQINHPTRNISNFLHETLLDTATNAPSYIKNSYELIEIIKQIQYHPDLILITCDIVSLYTNIPTKEGIELATKAYTEHNAKKENKLSSIAMKTLLNNTLINNVFRYNKDFYQQTNGTAMGTIMAPTYANCYLYYKEKPLLNDKRIIVFKRYIDDIFIIFNNKNNTAANFISDLRKTYLPLELTTETSKDNAIFLDTTISLNHIYRRLDACIYYKPLGNIDPIHINSDHPEHMRNNTLTGNALRINRLCTNKLDAFRERIILQAKYLKYKYPIATTKSAIHKANHHCPKENSEESNNTIRLKFTHNLYTEDIKRAFHNKWKEFDSPVTGKLSFSINLNKSIRETLVRTGALAMPYKKATAVQE